MPIKLFCVLSLALTAIAVAAEASGPTVRIDTPMPPPEWALLERELLRANSVACEEFYSRYFDDRGYLLCVERWGGNDGPDDAIENCNDWPILHALGAPDRILELYKKAWEGHLRQYTEARTTQVPFARDGMYYREFPVMMDWLHNGEGLTVFNLQGLSDPKDERFRVRVRRYAEFYLGGDPQAPNYDPERKIIRSLLNGSRGPLLRKATAVDWAGDPIAGAERFKLLHGERDYADMLAHFKDYNDVIGDHPSNLASTSLALNAYMLTHEERYRDWLLTYVDAWVDRTERNGGIIPSNIGLDGTIGGATDGKWYGGVYGWAFSVEVPQTGEIAHRQTIGLGVLGFLNAHFLTGDERYLEAWGGMIDAVNSNAKRIDGKRQYPHKYGDEGWYAFRPSKWSQGAMEIWYASMAESHRERLSGDGWIAYLEGRDPDYPARSLRRGLERIRDRVHAMRQDETTPDTRLADNPMAYNPATTTAMVELTLGGLHPGHRGDILRTRFRYFDPVLRRAGLPRDVAALVSRLSPDDADLTLVNIHQTETRELLVQTGSYGEHRCVRVVNGRSVVLVDGRAFRVRLEPGCGAKLRVDVERYAMRPSLAFPWDR